ncbi:hypothetical protein ACFLV7_00830 [Chloroflexota bacterium]
MPNTVPDSITELLKKWYKSFNMWQGIHYGLGIIGTVFSIIVAIRPTSLEPYGIEILAIISTLCIMLLAFLIPARRAHAMREAWRALNIATERFKLDNQYEIRDLLNTIEKCEKIISATDPT